MPPGSPPGATPALPLVCGLRPVVPGDALGSHIELPQPRGFAPRRPPACPAAAQGHQDPEARAACQHGSFRAPARRRQPRTGQGSPPPRLRPAALSAERLLVAVSCRAAPQSASAPGAVPPPRAFPGIGLAGSRPGDTRGKAGRQMGHLSLRLRSGGRCPGCPRPPPGEGTPQRPGHPPQSQPGQRWHLPLHSPHLRERALCTVTGTETLGFPVPRKPGLRAWTLLPGRFRLDKGLWPAQQRAWSVAEHIRQVSVPLTSCVVVGKLLSLSGAQF